MRSVLVTSFSPAGAALYGRRMVQTAVRYWPATVERVVYLDAPLPMPDGVTVRATTDLPEWVACRDRWAHDPVAQGKSTKAVPRRKPYSYRYDARRFAVKAFVWQDAARQLGEGVLTWLDGDTLTTRAVPADFPARLLGEADVAYLGRGSMHPETGYVGFRMPGAWPLLRWCADAYHSERFRDIAGWTDCHILRAGIAATGVAARDLTTAAYTGQAHIWPVSPLAPYVTHFKGKQKILHAAGAH